MNNETPDRRTGRLSAAFNKAVRPALEKVGYILTTYPSKATGASGLAADVMFMGQALENGNNIGVCAAVIGMYASVQLVRFGDPKISSEQKEGFEDPQDKRTLRQIVFNPSKYPWEHLGMVRVSSMGLIFAGGVAGASYGEIGYSAMALLGYAVKMGIAEREKGSVPVPETGSRIMREIYNTKAYVLENPNPTAGIFWNAGLVPYAAEAVLKGEYYKLASAALYFLPNTFTMLSSKRAQTLPSDPVPPRHDPA
ncbi:MAG: hypothetical protein DI626_05195 [Micavibrio aeruginosavorus]|uniref:Uncharacterized protein n=1 Tax=Micavibrio aeruginosavorus TaxID=349221 RepID=A0A2W4ZXC6_9BACT|nr:MAG: hypothetical protein DI626_05195 [Micavibrio aeruginosavorus]